MMANKTNKNKKNVISRNKPTSAASRAAAAAALSAMLACNVCPAQAFQATFLAPTPRTMYHAAALSSPVVPATTMRCPSPWDPECGGMQLFRRGGIQRRRRLRPMFQDSQLEIRDPAVAETSDSYQLRFELPAEVEQDGVDVSVSDRLLTIKARVTQDNPWDDTRCGGWATRSSTRTDSVSRSFVLPEGTSAVGVEASWLPDGTAVEVKFSKYSAKAKAGDAAAATNGPPASVAQAASAGSTPRTGEDKAPPLPSTSAKYLSSVFGAKAAAEAAAANADNVSAFTAEPTVESSPPPPADTSFLESQRSSRPEAVFAALESEFGGFAKKAVWGEDVLRFPTQEEMAERVQEAREARAKRVMMATRRATMATNVSEKDGSYFVKVALPEGASRGDVKLAVTSDKTLRVSFAAQGRRSIHKNVRLPKDARFSKISAKFEVDDTEGRGAEGGTSVAGEGVSGLEITVGRIVPPRAKRVDIEWV